MAALYGITQRRGNSKQDRTYSLRFYLRLKLYPYLKKAPLRSSSLNSCLSLTADRALPLSLENTSKELGKWVELLLRLRPRQFVV